MFKKHTCKNIMKAASRYRIYETEDMLYFVLENETENNKLYMLAAGRDEIALEPERYADHEQFAYRFGTGALLMNHLTDQDRLKYLEKTGPNILIWEKELRSYDLDALTYDEYVKIRKNSTLIADEKRHYEKRMRSPAKIVFSERLFTYVFDDRQICPPPHMLAFPRGFLLVQAENSLDADDWFRMFYPDKAVGVPCYTERCPERIWSERKKRIYKNMPPVRIQPITRVLVMEKFGSLVNLNGNWRKGVKKRGIFG